MAREQRDNSGILFKNDRKTKDGHPDRSGTAMIDGRMYWVKGWVKEGAKGPFMTLAFERKEDEAPPKKAAPTRRADEDSEIPF